jgi:predicted lipid-binding transport protein (Tim44 family)
MGATLALGLALVTGDADAAKRFGGGKSAGMQRQEMSQSHNTPASPAQAPGMSNTPARQQAAAPAPGMQPQAQPKRSWMGPLAGLAAGIGLAALASHFGFGEELASLMTMALIAFAVMALIGFIMRKKAQSAQGPALAGAGAGAPMNAPMHAPMDASANTPVPNLFNSQPTGGAAAAPQEAPASSGFVGHIPAEFDVESFVRNAKVNFIRLQAANDARNLEDIRSYTTPEMFAEVKMHWMEEGSAPQKTDVMNLDAAVLDLKEEASRYVVSVRYTGLLREDPNAAPEAIDEIWHLVKPKDNGTGWLVAGIQQNG